MRKTPARSRTIVRVWPGPRKGPATDRTQWPGESREEWTMIAPMTAPMSTRSRSIPIPMTPMRPRSRTILRKPDDLRLLPPHGVDSGI